MDRILTGTSKYIQGSGTIDRLGEYCAPLGGKVLVVADDFVLKLLKSRVEKTFKDQEIHIHEFQKECSYTEINSIAEKAKKEKIEYIIGIGGGKTLDTVKAAGTKAKLKTVVVPTLSSSDAPITGISVVYTDAGELQGYEFVNKPDYCIVDLDIIVNAPTDLLITGIGDALSTYFETRACYRSGSPNIFGGEVNELTLKIGELCFDTLLRNAEAAIAACEMKQASHAVAKVVEANIYLSGMAFENSSVSIAHSFVGATTINETLHKTPHGRTVAFGILVQLVVENDIENLNLLLDFYERIGLPMTIEELGLETYTEEDIIKIAEASFDDFGTIHNTHIKMTPEILKRAIISADGIGKAYREGEYAPR